MSHPVEAKADVVLDLGLAEGFEVSVGDRAVLHEGLIRSAQAFDQVGLAGEDDLQQPGPGLFDLGQPGETDQKVVGYRVRVVDQDRRGAAVVDLADQQVGEGVHLADALDLLTVDPGGLTAGLDQLVERQRGPAGVDDQAAGLFERVLQVEQQRGLADTRFADQQHHALVLQDTGQEAVEARADGASPVEEACVRHDAERMNAGQISFVRTTHGLLSGNCFRPLVPETAPSDATTIDASGARPARRDSPDGPGP